jgi:hypothetical protein
MKMELKRRLKGKWKAKRRRKIQIMSLIFRFPKTMYFRIYIKILLKTILCSIFLVSYELYVIYT